jgi:hypothetical protein
VKRAKEPTCFDQYITDTQLSRGFDAGNYANAYETTNLTQAITSLSPNRDEAYLSAFTLGFFATYELDEIPGTHQDTYLNAYHSPAGQRCLELGYIDPLNYR